MEGLSPTIDGRATPIISAYLFSDSNDENPAVLTQNKHIAYSGSNINGEGFVLSCVDAQRMIEADPSCCCRIKPYLSGDELNEMVRLEAPRYVIDFGDGDFSALEEYPGLLSHLSASVKLQRQTSAEARLRERWWIHSRPARELYSRIGEVDKLLASSRVSKHLIFSFVPTAWVFSDSLTLFVSARYSLFAVLQSRVHNVWAHCFGSSLEDRPRYVPEDCFETFPLPSKWQVNSALEEIGEAYYEIRTQVMAKLGEGLTDIYNRFHTPPEEADPGVVKLRELHARMDRAVLDAYGWSDLRPTCDFLSEVEEDGAEESEAGRPRPKKYRYRWSDEIHNNVLARLLELNRTRAEEEAHSRGPIAAAKPATNRGRKSRKNLPVPAQPILSYEDSTE
jgi:hypothetical protein